MIKGYYARIAAFLSEYVRLPGRDPVPPDVALIADAIRYLISSGVFTKESMKLEALRSYDVIIREDLFPVEARR